MKGIELPVNVLIIVAIGVIVLIGLVVLLGIGIGGVSPVLVQAELTNSCNNLRTTFGCDENSLASVKLPEDSAKRFGVTDLIGLCDKYKNTDANITKCAVDVCGCPVKK